MILDNLDDYLLITAQEKEVLNKALTNFSVNSNNPAQSQTAEILRKIINTDQPLYIAVKKIKEE